MLTNRPSAARFFVLAGSLMLALLLAASSQPASAQSFTSIYSFCQQSNCPDGRNPAAWLTQGPNGNFYGSATGGGTGNGTVFMISSSGALTAVHKFNGTDGSQPSALILATDGNFYGTTEMGGGDACPRGNGLCGTIFRINPGGSFTSLYRFCSQPNCADGFFPIAALVQGRDGNLYGTTQSGGNPGQCQGMGCGTIFKITLGGTLTTLYTFCPQGSCLDAPDGSDPAAALVQGADGNLYGTTQSGGSNDGCLFGCGTVFRITAGGALTTLHKFVNSIDGSLPGQIVQALDGNFYGVSAGSLFRMTPGGVLTTIHMFTLTDGDMPVGLVQATDGNLYGVTYQGGGGNCLSGCGTVFKTNYSGTLTTLHEFTGADGAAPTGGLVQGTDGNFYGTTSLGGSTNCQTGCGTVFKVGVGANPFVTAQPAFGGFGTPVTIFGTNLTGATGVTFNGTAATFNIVSSAEITATVPTSATTGTVQVTTPAETLHSNADFQVVAPLTFVAITPCRVVDTRPSGPIMGGTQQDFTLPDLGNCSIPTTAAAYSLNVTVSPRGPLGYLTIWPQGEIRPYASTMNSPDGRTKANAAIVPAGNDAVSVYVTNTTDVIIDINGYFQASAGQTMRFFPLPPCRVVDTRIGSQQPQGLGPPSLGAMETRDLPVLSKSPCLQGLPNTPQAYSFNVTAVPQPAGQRLSFLTVWPSDQPQPTASTLNNPTATVVANAAIVKAAANGDVNVFAANSTDLIVDINGYFATPGGLSFYVAPPCRAYDSRDNNGQPFSGERTVNVAGSPCGPPSTARAYVFNATVVPSPTLGFLTLWADGQTQPTVSTLNAYDGFVTSNLAIVPNVNGSTDAYAGGGMTQLILDISGYFAP